MESGNIAAAGLINLPDNFGDELREGGFDIKGLVGGGCTDRERRKSGFGAVGRAGLGPEEERWGRSDCDE